LVPVDGDQIRLYSERVPGWRAVHLDLRSRTARVPRGVEIDLGATAKALASDLAATAALAAMGGEGGVLVSLGGDIALAGEPPAGGWTIQISEDSSDALDDASEKVRLQGGGIATSSTRVRSWSRGEVELHHIIDPRTGTSARTPWRLVSVVADRCLDANIAATAAVIRGRAAVDWLQRLGLPARLVGLDGETIRVGGWPEPEEEPG
ncbi:MAG: FAD:protein FMN transferase, partial [Candidatus Dormibacteria bacterium]